MGNVEVSGIKGVLHMIFEKKRANRRDYWRSLG